jgi:hypothetical protein
MADYGHTPLFAKFADVIAKAGIPVDHVLAYHDWPIPEESSAKWPRLWDPPPGEWTGMSGDI